VIQKYEKQLNDNQPRDFDFSFLNSGHYLIRLMCLQKGGKRSLPHHRQTKAGHHCLNFVLKLTYLYVEEFFEKTPYVAQQEKELNNHHQ
jgi:hypothetical protein